MIEVDTGMKLAFLDKRPQVGLPQAEPFALNPVTGLPWEPWEQEEIDFFLKMRMTRGVMQVLGLPRSGKSTLMTWIAYKLRKYFGVQVTADFPFTPAFGDFNYMDEFNFLEELELMIEIVQKYKDGDANAFANSDSKLFRASVLWDESHQNLSRRRPMKGEILLKTDACSLWGHYQSLFVIAAPGTGLIEHIHLKDFITHDIGANFDEKAGKSIYNIYSRYDMRTWILTLTIADWLPLFDSACPVAPNISILHGTMEKLIKQQGVIDKYKNLKKLMEKGKRKTKGEVDDDDESTV